MYRCVFLASLSLMACAGGQPTRTLARPRSPATAKSEAITEAVEQELRADATQRAYQAMLALYGSDVSVLQSIVSRTDDLGVLTGKWGVLDAASLTSRKERAAEMFPPGSIQLVAFTRAGRPTRSVEHGTRAEFSIDSVSIQGGALDLVYLNGAWKLELGRFLGPQAGGPVEALMTYMTASLRADRQVASKAAYPGADLSHFTDASIMPAGDVGHLTMVVTELQFSTVQPGEPATLMNGTPWVPAPDETVLLTRLFEARGVFRLKKFGDEWRVEPFDAVRWMNQ